MGYLPYSCGFQRLTTSGVVSDSGKPILISGYGVESGGTAASPVLANGTAAPTSTTAALRLGPVTASQGNVESINLPVMFPNGCYVSFDSNTTAVTIFYILQATS